MTSAWDYRDIMKAHMRYNETRTVQQVLDAHEARDKERDRPQGASKTPPEPGRAATTNELDAVRAMFGDRVPTQFIAAE